VISFDTNLLVNIYQLKAGVPLSGATSSGTGAPAAKLPTPPWDPKSNVPRADELTKRALLGASSARPSWTSKAPATTTRNCSPSIKA
jgi:hypothetical protein